ncbi:hypothetical protein NLI96_g10316 [Meripilus lineatus]|uniref:Uncharacterized protein n=1 Tax=Meripilus lineatus TaxID=2056292 RepID=A0AAD5UW77_9APHY|nr:hypothetical protein NLI96_g10316 [Physisporinus lineatus]
MRRLPTRSQGLPFLGPTLNKRPKEGQHEGVGTRDLFPYMQHPGLPFLGPILTKRPKEAQHEGGGGST